MDNNKIAVLLEGAHKTLEQLSGWEDLGVTNIVNKAWEQIRDAKELLQSSQPGEQTGLAGELSERLRQHCYWGKEGHGRCIPGRPDAACPMCEAADALGGGGNG